jgi:hypothetical protein
MNHMMELQIVHLFLNWALSGTIWSPINWIYCTGKNITIILEGKVTCLVEQIDKSDHARDQELKLPSNVFLLFSFGDFTKTTCRLSFQDYPSIIRCSVFSR